MKKVNWLKIALEVVKMVLLALAGGAGATQMLS